MIHRIFIMIAAAAALHAAPAAAGSSENGKMHLPAEETAAFSDQVQLNLAARGAGIAIVARTGRPPKTLPEGVTYTHTALWVYSTIKAPDGSSAKGYRVYNLYQDQNDLTRSTLVQEAPADFFRSAHTLDTGVIIPAPQLQRKLLKAIASPVYPALHNPNYSVLSNPNTTQFQNCNELTLDLLIASIHGTTDKSRIKARIAAEFHPQPIRISGLKRFLAPAASAALTTSDHGKGVATVTFGSLARYLRAKNLASEVYQLTPGRAVRL